MRCGVQGARALLLGPTHHGATTGSSSRDKHTEQSKSSLVCCGCSSDLRRLPPQVANSSFIGALHFPPLLRARALHDLQMAAAYHQHACVRLFVRAAAAAVLVLACEWLRGHPGNPFKQRWLKRTFAPESLLVKGRCGLRRLACQELQGWVAPKQGLRGMPREDAAWPGEDRDGPRVGAQTRCVRAERQSCVWGCLQRVLETTAPHTPISTLRTRR